MVAFTSQRGQSIVLSYSNTTLSVAVKVFYRLDESLPSIYSKKAGLPWVIQVDPIQSVARRQY